MSIGKLNFNNIYAKYGSDVNNINLPKGSEAGKTNTQATESGFVNLPSDFAKKMDEYDKSSVDRPEQRSEFVGKGIYAMA